MHPLFARSSGESNFEMSLFDERYFWKYWKVARDHSTETTSTSALHGGQHKQQPLNTTRHTFLRAIYTADIKAFYPSTPHALILEAYESFNPSARSEMNLIQTLLAFNFTTNGKDIFYMGQVGIPMGLTLAPTIRPYVYRPSTARIQDTTTWTSYTQSILRWRGSDIPPRQGKHLKYIEITGPIWVEYDCFQHQLR